MSPFGWVAGIAASLLVAAYLTAVSASEFHREWSLAKAHAVIEARVTRVTMGKALRRGCTTNVWVEFRPIGSTEIYSYYGDFFFLNRPRPIGFLDVDDAKCKNVHWHIGDQIKLAYVPSDPRISRPYWGSLARGVHQDVWQLNAGLAILIALCGAWIFRGWRKQRYSQRH